MYICSIADLNAGMTLLLDARNSRTHSPAKHLLEKLVVSAQLLACSLYLIYDVMHTEQYNIHALYSENFCLDKISPT